MNNEVSQRLGCHSDNGDRTLLLLINWIVSWTLDGSTFADKESLQSGCYWDTGTGTGTNC